MTNNDIVERLRGFWLPNDTPSLIRDEAADEILRLRKERDEARVEACRLEAEARARLARMSGMSCHYFSPKQIAKEREWDCFDSVPSDIEAHKIRGDLPGGNP